MFKETVQRGLIWDLVTFSQVKRGEGGDGLFVCWLLFFTFLLIQSIVLVSGVEQSDSVVFYLYFSHCVPL